MSLSAAAPAIPALSHTVTANEFTSAETKQSAKAARKISRVGMSHSL